MTGMIPTEFFQLASLATLDLSDNLLSGSMLSEICLLSHINSLVLSENSITGMIPTELFQLASLATLHLSDNLLSGSIPSEIGYSTKLKTLLLSGDREHD